LGRSLSAVDVGCAWPEGNLKLRQLMKALYVIFLSGAGMLPTLALAQVSLETLGTCLAVEDQTKERLDCYDDFIKPAPKQVSGPAKTVQDCRFVKEEDERLNCFNRFVNSPPKKVQPNKNPKSRRLARWRRRRGDRMMGWMAIAACKSKIIRGA
jgi:hypothetical protein